MRQIEPKEVELIEFLAKAAGVCLSLYEKQPVWVVNPQMKSLRADYCPKGCRVFALISYQFDDLDNVPVVVSLLLTKDKRFGELDFWKVDDTPLMALPHSTRDLFEC